MEAAPETLMAAGNAGCAPIFLICGASMMPFAHASNPSPHGERRLARFLLWGEPQNAMKRRECDTQREAGKAGFRGNAARRSRAEPGTFLPRRIVRPRCGYATRGGASLLPLWFRVIARSADGTTP
jgi:hypothetical protein